MTASSFTSVSLDPALISLGVRHASQMHAILAASEVFVINLLAADQPGVAGVFAQPGLSGAEQWALLPGEDDGGLVIAGTMAWLRCVHHTRFVAGDHTIFIGQVVDGAIARATAPLVYHRRGYRSINEG